MNADRVTVTLDGFEQRLMVKGLLNFREGLGAHVRDDVNGLIIKVIEAPAAREKRREREAG